MSYQAGIRNFQVATGADNIFAIRFHRRGSTVPASEIVVGDWIIYLSEIWLVFSITPAGADKVTFQLGAGTFAEPTVTVLTTDMVATAPAAVWEAIDMQVALPETVWSPPPTTLAVPTEIVDEGLVCQVLIDQTWLEPFQAQIDYAEGGPSGMSLPYDLVGQFTGQRIRVLTGTISIVRSAASPVVAPPVPPEVTP
jgi:hypothetical protein